jgi:hypothetical protein
MSTLTQADFTHLDNDEAIIIQDFSTTTIFRNNGKRLMKTRLTLHDMSLSTPEEVTEPAFDPASVWFTVTELGKKVADQRLYHRLGWADAVDIVVATESREASRFDDDDLAAEIRMESICN